MKVPAFSHFNLFRINQLIIKVVLHEIKHFLITFN